MAIFFASQKVKVELQTELGGLNIFYVDELLKFPSYLYYCLIICIRFSFRKINYAFKIGIIGA